LDRHGRKARPQDPEITRDQNGKVVSVATVTPGDYLFELNELHSMKQYSSAALMRAMKRRAEKEKEPSND
jgi:hypothetical protein